MNELECDCGGALGEEALSRSQEERVDDEDYFVREALLKKSGGQGRAAREDQIGAFLRLEVANSVG